MSPAKLPPEGPQLPAEAIGPRVPIPAWLELPPLGWLSVVGATGVIVARLDRFVGTFPSTTVLYASPQAIAAALVALLPAALLLRVPDAPNRQRPLFFGLAAMALSEWWQAVLVAWSPPVLTANESVWTVLSYVQVLLGILAPLLVGLGLLRLRPGGATRPWLLLVIVGLSLGFLGLQVRLVTTWAQPSFDLVAFGPGVLLTAAGGVATWVPVSAWLDHDAPRGFWGLLALGFPLGLVASALGLAQALAMVSGPPMGLSSDVLFLIATTLGGLIGAVVSILAIAAYARLTPLNPEATPRPDVDARSRGT
jgi:hypothetical protein